MSKEQPNVDPYQDLAELNDNFNVLEEPKNKSLAPEGNVIPMHQKEKLTSKQEKSFTVDLNKVTKQISELEAEKKILDEAVVSMKKKDSNYKVLHDLLGEFNNELNTLVLQRDDLESKLLEPWELTELQDVRAKLGKTLSIAKEESRKEFVASALKQLAEETALAPQSKEEKKHKDWGAWRPPFKEMSRGDKIVYFPFGLTVDIGHWTYRKIKRFLMDKDAELDGGKTEENEPKFIPEGPLAEQIELAIEKLGKENVLGPKEVEKTFGVRLTEIPEIPFSVEELEQAEKLGQMLVLRVDQTKDGKPMSLEAMNEAVKARWQKEGKGALFNTPKEWKDWLKADFNQGVPRAGWALTSKDILPDSTSKNYIQQTEVLINHLKTAVFKGMAIPKEYTQAIQEFESNQARLTSLMAEDWQEAAKQLSELKITKLTRQTTEEAIYDLALYYDKNKERLLKNKYIWLCSRSPGGYLVNLGDFDSAGVGGGEGRPGGSGPGVGVSFSRSL